MCDSLFRHARGGEKSFHFEVVAHNAAELPLPQGARALFVLKRRHRLCMTDPQEVDAAGGVEWNTVCTQTATLHKQGDSWRPKEFVFKVQVVRENLRLGQEDTQTVAKAALDLSQFCMPEPLGPRHLVIPLQPAGLLSVSIRTHWLQNYTCEQDSFTDLSTLSLGQSAATSTMGGPVPAEEQDLAGFVEGGGGFLGAPGSTLQEGGIRAVYPANLPAGRGVGSGGGGIGSALQKTRLSMASMLRVPRRSTINELQSAASMAAAPGVAVESNKVLPNAGSSAQRLHRSATNPSASLADRAAAVGVASRRPAGASSLTIPTPPTAEGGSAEAGTPTLFGQQNGGKQAQVQRASAVQGLPPEMWSPVNLQEAVDKIYESDEEPTPKPTMFGTVKRMFSSSRARSVTPRLSIARQLHATFGTPLSTAPKCTPDPCEVATIDRELSIPSLRRRCKRLLVERDEARAEGYAASALAVEQSVEIDKLKRAKAALRERLRHTEEQLLACYRDEASSDLIQALAAARVEAAQREFRVLDLEGQLRHKDAFIDKQRAQLTRFETKYRLHALTPSKDGPPAPWSGAASPAAANADAQAPLPSRKHGSEAAGAGQQWQAAQSIPVVLPSRLHGEQNAAVQFTGGSSGALVAHEPGIPIRI